MVSYASSTKVPQEAFAARYRVTRVSAPNTAVKKSIPPIVAKVTGEGGGERRSIHLRSRRAQICGAYWNFHQQREKRGGGGA